MINVLEHCFDLNIIFEKIQKILNKGGILLLADKVLDYSGIKESLENIYDAGHPMKISKEYFENKIQSFKVLYSKEFSGNYETTHKYLILQK